MGMLVAGTTVPLRSTSQADGGEAGRRMSPTGDGGEPSAPEVTLADQAASALEALRAGDPEPLNRLVGAVTPLLWYVVRAQNVPREAAEDVVQGVWLAFVRKADTIRDPQATLRWLVVTARRAGWEATRKHRDAERRTTSLGEADGPGLGSLPTADPGPDEVLLTAERDRALWRAFGRLSERCKQILGVLAFAERPSYRLVAEVTGMGLTSVGTTRARCLARLRAELEAETGRGTR